MGKTIAIANQKGGVAKTLTATSLAAYLKMIKGFRVLLVDSDPQGDASRQFTFEEGKASAYSLTELLEAEIKNRQSNVGYDALGDEPERYEYSTREAISVSDSGVDVICSTGRLASVVASFNNDIMRKEEVLRAILDQVKDDYDYIIIDSNPTLSTLTTNVLAAADEVIIPTFAEEDPIHAIGKLMKTIANVKRLTNPDIKVNGVLFTNVEARQTVSKHYMNELREANYFYVYDAYIPHIAAAKEARTAHLSLFEYDRYGKATVAYEEFGKEFLRREKELEEE